MGLILVYCMALLPFITTFLHAHESAPIQSLISQCPERSVPELRSEAQHFELSLLFYFVSWSSDARQARLVYDGVANYYYDFAYFAAIDCWHMQCNCSHTHRPMHGLGGGYPDKWPTLIVNYGSKISLQYMGAWQFEQLTRFMNNLIQPIDRIQNNGELTALRRISDAVVLALLDSANTMAYRGFTAAAIRWLEFDPERNIRFTVTFGANAKQLLRTDDIALPQLVVIDNRNRMHTYNETPSWKSRDILRWVSKTLKATALLTDGYGTPMTFALKASRTPVLAMAISTQQSTTANKRSGSEHSLEDNMTGTVYINPACDNYMSMDDQNDVWSAEQTLSLLQMPVELYASSQHSQPSRSATDCYRTWQLNVPTLINYYRINSYLNYLWSQFAHHTHSTLATDILTTQLLALHVRNRCLAQSHQDTPAVQIGIAKLVKKYGELMWQHSAQERTQNRSLGVVLFDAYKYRDFLQQLSIPEPQYHKGENTAVQVFIVDAAQESVHAMPQHNPFSYLALKEFIKLFYARQLPRVHKNSLVSPNPSASFIYNYNRQLLLQALQRPNVTNVVLMYRTDCALSAVLSQTLLQVAALLRSPNLNFIRFDSRANDLPWELSMPVSPTLIVFPRGRPTESVVFPVTTKVNVQNVFAFIIAQLEPEQQLRQLLDSCRLRMRHVRSCLDLARSLVMQHVSQYLKYWEIFEKERDLILSHLKQFNDIHIAIESSIRL